MFLFLILILIILICVIFTVCNIAYQKLILDINKCSKHLVGKVVIVTGGNAGIGFETAKDLAFRGATVIIACRNDARGLAARDKIIGATNNHGVRYMNLDLASFASVRKFANEFINSEKRLDILINNAGVLDPEFMKTEDGLLYTMQINHFGPFLLTNLLLPLLKTSAPSRIINVSSIYHKTGIIDFENLNMENRSNLDPFYFVNAYGSSKLCNILMTVELKRKLDGTGVTANCLHPGMIRTRIMNSSIRNRFWVKYITNPVIWLFSKTPWEGAQTSIHLAVSPEVQEISGCYFENCKVKKTHKIARDPETARKLWDVSEKIVGL